MPIFLPIGATEENGHHMSLNVDVTIPAALCHRSYGYAPDHVYLHSRGTVETGAMTIIAPGRALFFAFDQMREMTASISTFAPFGRPFTS